MILLNNFKAFICFLKKSVNKTFIVQNCAKIPTKKQNKNTKDKVMLTSREDEAFYFIFIFLE
jgi:hypothetical protein